MFAGRRYLERALAVASFIVAAALAFTSLLITEDHDIMGNTMFVIAQFLTLCATILGIDYKFSTYGTTPRNPQQQPPQYHQV